MKSLIFLLLAIFLINCRGPQGDSIVGPQGEPGQSIVGPQGPAGQDGADGQDGEDATPVTVVQLCPGTTTYPSKFVEVALCLNGELYAVYSANNGFLVHLVPGAYTSNGIGSSCNFTVLSNCKIQP